MTNWQPIETAPKDGTFILGWILGEFEGPIVAVWRKTPHVPLYGWHPYWCLDPENNDMVRLSYWLPIPNPPESQCAAHTEAVGGSQVSTPLKDEEATHGEHNERSEKTERTG